MFEVHTFAPPNSSVWLSLYHQVTRVTTLEVHAGEDSKAESKHVVAVDDVCVLLVPRYSSTARFNAYNFQQLLSDEQIKGHRLVLP